MKRAHCTSKRRALLALLGLSVLLLPGLHSGCAATFDPPSLVNSLRVLAVKVDKPYASPGEEVQFEMVYSAPEQSEEDGEGIQIAWFAGCANPIGDQYYGCYPQLAENFARLSSGDLADAELFGQGKTFQLKLPEDIIDERPIPDVGSRYGIAYVFFAVCQGKLKPIDSDQGGEAGSFPLGCFDNAGNRLGADRFVPGFTQVYSFEDGRPNKNPTISDLLIDGASIPTDGTKTVSVCPTSEDDRRTQSCGKEDPFEACTTYEMKVAVPTDVAEIDPQSLSVDGTPLREVVWVNYYADAGNFAASTLLVSDATKGYQEDHGSNWIPPDAPGPVRLWAVVRDARGGVEIIERTVVVE